MNTKPEITEDFVFSHFLDCLEGKPNPEREARIREDEKGNDYLDAYEKLHGELGRMRFSNLTPGGVASAHHPEIPKEVGGFQILGQIGEGGMGAVFKAFDPSLNRVLAIKVIKNLHKSESAQERFQCEARSLARMRHPGIIQIFSFGRDGENHPFIAMEYLKGGSLREELSERGPLPPGEVLELARHLAQALEHAHRCGVLHRDIKPDNLLRESYNGRIVMTDFGLSKMIDLDPMTMEGEVMGTLVYMSPEQLQGEPMDERSDIFSLGVTLFELLTGNRPFKGRTSAQLLEEIRKGRALRQLRHEIQWRTYDRFLAVLEKAVAYDPAHRWVSAAEFEKALPSLTGEAPSQPIFLRGDWLKVIGAVAFACLIILGSWWISRPNQVTVESRVPAVSAPVQVIVGMKEGDFSPLRTPESSKPEPEVVSRQEAASVETTMIPGSVLLSEVKLNAGSGLDPVLGERLRFLIKGHALPKPWHWSPVGRGGESQARIVLDTSGSDLTADMTLRGPDEREYQFSARQRIELSLERLADELMKEFTKVIHHIPKGEELP